jgi:hypothetical protein
MAPIVALICTRGACRSGHIRWHRERRYVDPGAPPLEPEVAGRPNVSGCP